MKMNLSCYLVSLTTLGLVSTGLAQTMSPSTTTEPYILPLQSGIEITSILTVGDKVTNSDDPAQEYAMCGIPDGMGVWPGSGGTFWLALNHEFGSSVGIARAHGGTGSFVSVWQIDSDDFTVMSGADLALEPVQIWNAETSSYAIQADRSMGRFCSGDLADVSAFYNSETGLGTQDRIYMNGEEIGFVGIPFAHVINGDQGRTSYEVPALGKSSWENVVANPYEQDITIVAGLDDAHDGIVSMYVGMKKAEGDAITKAGLTGGDWWLVQVEGKKLEKSRDPALSVVDGDRFTLMNMGDVTSMEAEALEVAVLDSGATLWGRPEDGAWDPTDPSKFYFVTTGGNVNRFFNNGGAVDQRASEDRNSTLTRLFLLDFDDITNPAAGGVVRIPMDAELTNGLISQLDSEGLATEEDFPFDNLDNLSVDPLGLVWLTEDPGSSERVTKMHVYDPTWDVWEPVAEFNRLFFQGDRSRPEAGVETADFDGPTRLAYSPFPDTFLTTNEEASGIVDLYEEVGFGYYIVNAQNHMETDHERTQQRFGWTVEEGIEYEEGGQLLIIDARNYVAGRYIPGAQATDAVPYDTYMGNVDFTDAPYLWNERIGWTYFVTADPAGNVYFYSYRKEAWLRTNADLYPIVFNYETDGYDVIR